MQEREKTRCKSDMAYHCATHDTQWLDDESDRCEYKRMVDAEAAIARVRELHGRHDPNCPYGEDCAGTGLCLACREEYPCATIRALDGLEGRIDD